MHIAIGRFSRPIISLIFARLHDMVSWLGIEQFLQREWTDRLPAVIVAATLLAIYAWASGIHQEDLYLIPALSLTGAVLSIIRELQRKPVRKSPRRTRSHTFKFWLRPGKPIR